MNARPLVRALAALILTISVAAEQRHAPYPQTRKVDHVDTYHGVQVPDPYRWLEDDTSDDTAAWVEAQNKVTFGYLEAIPYRAAMQKRVKALNDYEKYSAPSRKGPYFFFRKNAGTQKQSVLYIQKGLNGTPEVLLDPNGWEDGTVQLGTFAPSKDAKYAVYGVSKSGSDWTIAWCRRTRSSTRRRCRSWPAPRTRRSSASTPSPATAPATSRSSWRPPPTSTRSSCSTWE